MDADGGAEGSHVVRHVREHPLSRVLPSSRLQEVRVQGFMAYARLLRESRRALPLCPVYTNEKAVLGSDGRRTLANRLAADESGGMIGECVLPLPLHIFQLLLRHAE